MLYTTKRLVNNKILVQKNNKYSTGSEPLDM